MNNKPVSAKNAHTPTSLEDVFWYWLVYAPDSGEDRDIYWEYMVEDLREAIKQKYEEGFVDGFNNAMGNTELKEL